MGKFPTRHRPGDIVSTDCRPRIFAIACHGIRLWQRWGARMDYSVQVHEPTGQPVLLQGDGRGYPSPHWRRSHVGIVVDRDLVFEVTWPTCRFTPIEDFVEKTPHWIVLRRQLAGQDIVYSDQVLEDMNEAAAQLFATEWNHYDPGQLLNHVVLDLFGVAMDRWTRITDLSARQKVCSAGTAYVEEFARRKMIDAVGARELGEEVRIGGVLEPWPRAFRLPGSPDRFIHTERVKPADYSYHPDYRHEEEGP